MPMFKVTCKWNGKPWEKDIEAEDETDCTAHMYLFGVLIGKADIQDLQITEIKEKKTMSGHPHADLMAKAAEIAKTDKEWWRNFQVKDGSVWITFSSGDFAFSPNREYRLKPRYIDINGHQVPEPVQEPLEYGTGYCVVGLDGIDYQRWCDDEDDENLLKQGRIHLTREAAEAHHSALISFTQK
ncbi:hypothetical protein [Morganella morganii]|uniref:hypothetical protein n=3 Tax=Morganella morganii TaxID=582 RepID=UPI001A2BDF23|nr:hypothetical protein [Morganella morganii]ELB1849383.1 hypothetical protein [Morganella morganii]MBT0459590.1 hypothetical protein [Morganella morganii subsp. morganii]MBT0490820.1 hypothetical protein [Morganella morganii subsp. morganii]MBT0493456.1 hypothetical protein [Morganella morganii subsp. morganii]MDE2537967.1 hypothetical protein [Morganella morganii]